MKIKRIDTLVCHARMRNWVFVKVVTDQPGLIGWGEATLEWHTRSVVGAVEDLAELLVGEDSTRPEHLWQMMYRQPESLSGRRSRGSRPCLACSQGGSWFRIQLIFSIPILGYIYGEASEVEQYATAVRFVFVPAIVLSGFWMYSGLFLAIIGVAVWLGAYRLSGSGAAILSEVALFIARKTWLVIRARQSK